jgi:hypothetical protein
MTEATHEKMKKAIQVLTNTVAAGKGELRIMSAETLAMECQCLKDLCYGNLVRDIFKTCLMEVLYCLHFSVFELEDSLIVTWNI